MGESLRGLRAARPNRRLPPPRLVLLYVTCTLNKGYLQPYDHARLTPSLAAFAKDSVVFTNHQTESRLSGTSFASIFSGTQGDRHGVFKHPKRLPNNLFMIAEAFSDAGYVSHHWWRHPLTSPRFNYGQGVTKENITRRLLRAGDPKFQDVLRKLQENPEYRAFIMTSFTVTHSTYAINSLARFLSKHPHRAPMMTMEEMKEHYRLNVANQRGLATRFEATVDRLGLSSEQIANLAQVVDLVYESRVNFLDELFGKVLAEIEQYGLADQSLVVFTADHGETLYDENRRFKWTHSPELLPEIINVPLMIRASGMRPRRIDAVTRSIDVYPTIAGLAGVGIPKEARLQGIDLSGALRGRARFPELAADSHGTLRHMKFFDPDRIENIWASRKIRDTLYRWKPASKSKWEFEVFDLGESTDLTENQFDAGNPEHQKVADELWTYRMYLIEQYYAHNPREAETRSGEREQLTEQQIKALKSLGYIQ